MTAKPLCKHLRNKSMYIPALAKAADDPQDTTGHSGHCWCNCTLSETGPDDAQVHPERCVPSRTCFEE